MGLVGRAEQKGRWQAGKQEEYQSVDHRTLTIVVVLTFAQEWYFLSSEYKHILVKMAQFLRSEKDTEQELILENAFDELISSDNDCEHDEGASTTDYDSNM